MSRLTHKVDEKYYPNMNNIVQQKDYEVPNYRTLIHTKLGKLEDLEEELGCPLEVVFKAIEDGIVIKSVNDKFEGATLWENRPSFERALTDGDILDFEEPRLIKYINWCFSCKSGCYNGCVKLKDYQKTWFLKGEKR